MNPEILVVIETPIALFSTCLPSIFQLIRRVDEKRRLGTANTSKQITGGGDVQIGALGNPLNDNRTGFMRLDNRSGEVGSEDRFYAGQEQYKLTSLVQGGKSQVATGETYNIPSQQIHIRRDVDVEASIPG